MRGVVNKIQQVDQQGLTLLELLIAVAILSIAVLAAFGPLQQFARTNGETEARAAAVQLAQAKLEEVKARGFTYCQTVTDPQIETNLTNGPQGITFDRVLTVNSDNDLATVQVTVAWDYRGQHRTMTFDTSVVNMGD